MLQCRNLHGDPAEVDAIALEKPAAGLIESWA